MKYTVLLPVEINDRIRLPGDTIEDLELKPAPEKVRDQDSLEELTEPVLSEAESLVKSGHLEPAE